MNDEKRSLQRSELLLVAGIRRWKDGFSFLSPSGTVWLIGAE